MTSSSTEAEDLVGSTLLLAFRRAESCDGRFPFAWIVQIMRNANLHKIRSSPPPTLNDEELGGVIDAQAHHALLNKIDSIDILAALDRLPEEYRLVVALCDMEELDYAEAAVALNIPIGTVRSRLSRGRKQLQNLLAGWSLTR